MLVSVVQDKSFTKQNDILTIQFISNFIGYYR